MPANIFLQRLAFTIGALLIYRVGSGIPVPGLDTDLLTLMSRTPSIERLSIFALGVTPIFSALLVFEFLKLVFPPLARWEAADRTHARRLYNVVYAVAVAMAAIQAYSIAVALQDVPGGLSGLEWILPIAATMTAGVMLLGWLGDRISRHGVGTGFWLILILPQLIALPSTMAIAMHRMQQGAVTLDALVVTTVFLLMALTAEVVVVLLDRNRRAIPANAERPEYRVSGPDFALVWPPLLGLYTSDFVISLLSWPESEAAQLGLVATLILAFAGLQTLGTVRTGRPGERLQPWIIAAVQIFISLGCDIAAEKLKLPIRGMWLIIVVVTIMNLLRDCPPVSWPLRPKAT